MAYFAWHPPVLPPTSKQARSKRMHRRQWIMILCTAGLAVLFLAVSARSQEPPPTSPPAPASPTTPPSKPGKQKYSHVNDYLIRGTVFTEKAISFPGAQLRIRKIGEKKYRWESYTNSRGEFAVRVPQGSDYEMMVRARGYAEQTRAIDAKSGAHEENMVFRMQLTSGGKG
jgi:carboxypeptidase family protein